MPDTLNTVDQSEIATFFRLIPSASMPVPADPSAGGTLPVRAYRYCEPIRTASSLGWYLFPPISFTLYWDGTEIVWKYDGADEWMPLNAAQFPKFAPHFNEKCPEDIRDYSPPFLTSVVSPGIVQVWSGLIARTAPDWNLLIRPPANVPRLQHYESFEGLIETDQWFGPLFTNIRLLKTNTEIHFQSDHPFCMIQPLPRIASDPKLMQRMGKVQSMDDMTETDWQNYRDTIVNRVGENRKKGDYAARTRKRRTGKP